MARKFLYLVAACIVLAIAALIALRIWDRELSAIAFVPTTEYTRQPALEPNAYQDPGLWYSRPDKTGTDPARWQPAWREPDEADAAVPGDFAVFFIHPTSYFEKSHWNAPPGDSKAERITRIYLRAMASPFNQAREIWAPHYRQATFGAFLTDAPEGQMAIDLAYRDVAQAFDYFRASIGMDTPVVLAAHSQGSLHLLRLLKEKVVGTPMADRLIAAYAIGWPISLAHDLPALGIPACESGTQSGCIVSWSSFAEPADPSQVLEAYARSSGLDGQLRGDSMILCTNPLTGAPGGKAAAARNLGTLVPGEDNLDGELVAGLVPARCDSRGVLLIGEPPEMGSYVLPGNNYHVYDIPLFWANTQLDVGRRAQAWAKIH